MARGGKRPGAGRPKGAPNKVQNELRELAQSYTQEALNTLVDIARNGESDAARVSAANSVLDRAYGKPAQAVTGDSENPIEFIHRIERAFVNASDKDG